LAHPFFGLNPEHREVMLEEAFILGMHMHMSYDTVYHLPVRYRRWFIERLIKYNTPKRASAMEDVDTPLVKAT